MLKNKQIMANFQKLEVSGSTKNEALARAPFEIMGDATQAFKMWKAKQDSVTDNDVRQFCIDYLAKKNPKNVRNVGYSITLQSAVADTRERPYKVENVVREGKRENDKTYIYLDDNNTEIARLGTEWGVLKDKEGNPKVDEETGKVKEGKIRPTKQEAAAFLKELISEHRKNIHVDEVRVDPDATVLKGYYTPSKSSKKGTYLVFGIAM